MVKARRSSQVPCHSTYSVGTDVITALFTMARENAPSIVFFDEIDALMSERGSTREHEASRRVKSQLLSELDGIHSAAGHETGGNRIVMIATTNRPWDLDEAMRRSVKARIVSITKAPALISLSIYYLTKRTGA